MRLELTRVGLLVKLANHYTTTVPLIVKNVGFIKKGTENYINKIAGSPS